MSAERTHYPENHFPKGLLALMAFGAGAAVANLYYAQPLLATLGEFFGAKEEIGLVAVATQAGYTVGIFFLLPLGDLLERRKLISLLAFLLTISLLLCAVATSIATLASASFLVGIGATVTQMLVPLAAAVAPANRRSKAVGIVFSGILAGILLARTVSGIVGELLGWRAMFALASLVSLVLGGLLFYFLPRIHQRSELTYRGLLASLLSLFLKHAPLRTACAIQACLFSIFSAFWSILSLHLGQAPFNMGPAMAGSFGVIGVVGIVAANLGGSVIDRVGRKITIVVGLTCCVLAYVIFGAGYSLPLLIAGIVMLDFGLSIVNVANQSSILGLDSSAASRINAIYVTSIFLGGAVGSLAGTVSWNYGGWPWLVKYGLVVSIVALVIHARTNSKPSK
jgi:predicted MFS family arabinose efflux permease